MGCASAEVAGAAGEARIQRLVDARCLEHQLLWLRRSLWLLPMETLWLALAWHAGVAPAVVAAWGAARLGVHLHAARLGRRLVPLIEADPAAGLRRASRVFYIAGALHGVLMPVYFFGPGDDVRLLAMLLIYSYAGAVVISASGRQRTYWLASLPILAVVLLGWAWRGGGLGWAMVALQLSVLPPTALSIRQQRRSWETLVRLGEERNALAVSLGHERDRAETASAARTRFFAAASHDLRQPLHALSINATTLQLIGRRAEDAQLMELSESIGRALAQSQGLLDALLDISRLDAGAVKLHWASHDVGDLLRQLHTEFAGVAAQRGLSFTLALPETPAWVRTDADQLQRILRNLLDNAFKFTDAGRVHLALAREGGPTGLLRITVADTGCGIAAADRDKVFEEFFQVGNPARDRSHGLGLGLAIVRRTAALLGVHVGLAPASGPGTVFELRLPEAAPARPALSDATVVPEPAARLGVLLVDDEADILRAVCGLLQAVGWQARAAGSVEAALALAADPALTLDAAVVDHRLPGASGTALAARLRELRPALPVLVVTGDVAVQWEVSRHGLRVLHKPLDGASLTAAIAVEVAAAARWARRADVFRAGRKEPAMNLIDALHGRRSVRSFLELPPPRDVIEDLVWHAAQVPLPPVSDERSWAFLAVEGRERLAGWGRQAKRFAAEHPPPGQPWTWPARSDFEVFWGAPLLVLICARQGHPEAPFDCCRAGQNLSLAAHARGLGSCWIGSAMPWLASAEGRQAVGLPEGFDPAVALALGYPAGTTEGRSRPRPAVQWCEAPVAA